MTDGWSQHNNALLFCFLVFTYPKGWMGWDGWICCIACESMEALVYCGCGSDENLLVNNIHICKLYELRASCLVFYANSCVCSLCSFCGYASQLQHCTPLSPFSPVSYTPQVSSLSGLLPLLSPYPPFIPPLPSLQLPLPLPHNVPVPIISSTHDSTPPSPAYQLEISHTQSARLPSQKSPSSPSLS